MIARLRLFRMAAAYRCTGTVTHLADPFGGTLSHEIVAGTLRLWSVGCRHQPTSQDRLEVPIAALAASPK